MCVCVGGDVVVVVVVVVVVAVVGICVIIQSSSSSSSSNSSSSSRIEIVKGSLIPSYLEEEKRERVRKRDYFYLHANFPIMYLFLLLCVVIDI